MAVSLKWSTHDLVSGRSNGTPVDIDFGLMDRWYSERDRRVAVMLGGRGLSFDAI